MRNLPGLEMIGFGETGKAKSQGRMLSASWGRALSNRQITGWTGKSGLPILSSAVSASRTNLAIGTGPIPDK